MRNRLFTAAFILVISQLIIAPHVSCAATLTLRERVEVESNTINLSDIVRERIGDGSDRMIADSPPWGSEKVLTADFVKNRIRDIEVDLSGSNRVVVLRKTIERRAEVHTILEELIGRKLRDTSWGTLGDSLRLELVRFPGSLKLPPGRISIDCELPRRVSGLKNVSFTVSAPGGFRRRFSSQYRFHVTARCAVAKRDLGRNEHIDSGGIDWVEMDLSECYEIPVTERIELCGQRMKRFVREGDVIPLSAIERVPDVKKGEEVSVEISRGCLFISAKGRSLEDGRIGDRVLVRNLVNDRIEKYIVTGKGRVSVTSGGRK